VPDKTFLIIPNGGNPRRWIYNANRKLADLITDEIKDESEWLVDLEHLSSFVRYKDDLGFLKKFLEIRAFNKWRLLNWIKKKSHTAHLTTEPGEFKIEEILFDIMVKRVDEKKR
jgi:glycogen phosphorylase